MRVYLDIETATQVPVLARRAAEDLGTAATDPEAVMAWCGEHAGDDALTPITGRVVCWAVATEDQAWVRVDERESPDAVVTGEADLLARLQTCLEVVKATQIVAHNGTGFDAPFIRARALAHGLPELARMVWQSKPWKTRIIDTSLPEWAPRPMRPAKGWGYSLDTLADLLGIDRADTLPGEEVPTAWYEGHYGLVEAHCRDDVETLRAVYHRLAAGRD